MITLLVFPLMHTTIPLTSAPPVALALIRDRRTPHLVAPRTPAMHTPHFVVHFGQQVPRGLLPAVEIDGKMMTESIAIMQTIDQMFPTDNMMVPWGDEQQMTLASNLMSLERELFGAWCSYVFQPGDRAQNLFESTLSRVDKALANTPGPWFLGGGHPTIVDMQYVSHIERMLPSCLYWKGLKIR